MTHTQPSDLVSMQDKIVPEPYPPAPVEGEELSEAQLHTVIGGTRPQPIQPCL